MGLHYMGLLLLFVHCEKFKYIFFICSKIQICVCPFRNINHRNVCTCITSLRRQKNRSTWKKNMAVQSSPGQRVTNEHDGIIIFFMNHLAVNRL